MNILKRVGTLAAIALIATGCEDITNPVEESGQLADPYVRFENATGIAAPEGIANVIFQLPTRVTENVTVAFSFGGDAVYGDDFVAVDEDGNERSDVTAAGGTATIPYDPEQTSFARDTLFLMVLPTAVDGRSLEVEIESATTASGKAIETGYIETYRVFTLSIEGFVEDLPTGTYTGQRTGQLGTAAASVTVSKPAEPIVVGGAEYMYELSDYTGDGGVFGVGIPWAFNVTSGGTAVFAPASHVYNVTSDVTGSYNFGTSALRLNVTLTCCGGDGLTWSLNVAQ